MDSDKEPESNKDLPGIISKFKDASLDAGTLLQVNATAIIGVLFFVTISSALPSEVESDSPYALFPMSIGIIFPFAVSAILIIVQKRASRITWGFTAFGFALLFLGLLWTYYFAVFSGPINSSFRCAQEPGKFGIINESYLWQCSMFTPGSLAEMCARYPEGFNTTLSECHKFIPPSTKSGG